VELVKPREDPPFDAFVLTEQAASWDSFLGWLNELQGSWGFRGQREAEWSLHTSLDRAAVVSHSYEHGSGSYSLDHEKVERELLYHFQQQAHHYIHHLPPDDDLSSWIALMQHHCANPLSGLDPIVLRRHVLRP
jgi:FRG domain-containing protein